ncbi:DUF6480 family protein [Kitasatospora paranensis]|uniref:DUF6480 family protein n=1 Tax=Kitasatospora paranensis TaxID=258053 RepID=A0ABW2G3S7_9ACTN
MAAAGSDIPLSEDQADLYAWAGALGWSVDGGTPVARDLLRIRRSGRLVEAHFWHDGGFRFARAHGPDGPDLELDLPSTLDFLEHHGTDLGDGPAPSGAAVSKPVPPSEAGTAAHAPPAGVPPQETRPGEGSTTAGISVPEPTEVRRAWGPWPIAVLAVLVACVVLFFIARAAG